VHRIHDESIVSEHLISNHVEADRLMAVNTNCKATPIEALSLPRPETATSLVRPPFGSSVRTLRDVARHVKRFAPPTPLAVAPAAAPTTPIPATMLTDAQCKRVGLENGVARGLRRDGRVRH
jgi:hypothetical protein